MKNLIWILIGILIGLILGYLLFKGKEKEVIVTSTKPIPCDELFRNYQASIISRDSMFAGMSFTKEFNDSLHTYMTDWTTIEYVFALDSLKKKVLLVSGFKTDSSDLNKPMPTDSVVLLSNLDSKNPAFNVYKIDNSIIKMAQKTGNSRTQLILEQLFNTATALNNIYTCPKYCPSVTPSNLTPTSN